MLSSRAFTALAAGLGVVVLLLYLPTVGFDFSPADDEAYITSNPYLHDGLSASTIAWAFSSTYFGWWHPTTWLSHLLDVSLFDRWAGGHHLTSAVLHAANAVLLVFVLRRFGVGAWAALVVSALVMLHPTRVETVAWISERKDVLSETLLLVTCLLWQRYRQGPSLVRYALVCVVYAFALMAKTMVVSLPVLLLIVDAWTRRTEPWSRLVLEKVPLAVVGVGIGLTTAWTQNATGAMPTVSVDLGTRVAQVPVAWWWYLKNTFWPNDLCPYYEREDLRVLPVALAAAATVALVALLWVQRKRVGHLVAGLLFFVVSLGPVVGIIQVGGQAIADRYLYLPHMGLFAGLVLSVPKAWLERFALAVRAGLACALVGLAGLSLLQLTVWRDASTYYTSLAACAPDSVFARTGVALWLLSTGRLDEGLEASAQVAGLSPWGRSVHALALIETGREEDGLREAEETRRTSPRDHNVLRAWVMAYTKAGARAGERGDYARAVALLQHVVEVVPDDVDTNRLLAMAREDLRLRGGAPGPDAGAPP